MRDVFICDGIRTPIGRYGGALASIRPDDLAAIPLRALKDRNPEVIIDDVILGCANQAGEDNRNVARMAALLAGLPQETPGVTVNRLCASGLEAVGQAFRAIALGEAEVLLAGGVESMSRAPFVMPKSDQAFDRKAEIYDTTIGWRFVNKKIADQYGIESMPETAENLAAEHQISREDQDAFALLSQTRAEAATEWRKGEIIPVSIQKGKTEIVQDADEHPRADTTREALAKLRTVREGGTVTAGNASGVNDGAAALLVASKEAVEKYGLKPIAKIRGMASAGVPPRTMGIGPVPATAKLLSRLNLEMSQMDVVELNEAFAAQVLAVTRAWGVADNDPRINAKGGAIALGHPLGMTGARLVLTAARRLQETDGKFAFCTLCVGVGQGVSLVLEKP